MRILLVEDDDDIATVVKHTLNADGFSVDRTADGAEGLWMAEEGLYGLIVLDLLLPGMNGYKVCGSLRSKGIGTPVLMLTAKAGEYDETDGFDAGADDYLRKPFFPTVLSARVRSLIRRGSTAALPTSHLARGGIYLEPQTRKCLFQGSRVQLTGRQAEVLETLLRAGDMPISRMDLVRAVWGFEFDGDPNVADVYINYLRTKLGKETIENVRGLGYRVKE